ncbi:MAG: hypothetical protein KDA22_13505 [Phycisphaerales bacterium]|nr:hypothetical protein [Phycisphaerales bacterium]
MRTFSRTVRSIAIARVPRVVAPLIATAILTIVAPGETRAGSPAIVFNGNKAFPSRTISRKVCWFPPCRGGCLWDWTETEVDLDVFAGGSATLSSVDYTLQGVPGGAVISGSLPAGGQHVSGTLNALFPGEFILDPCGTVRVYVYSVTAKETWDNGLSRGSTRQHIVTLRCDDCSGNVFRIGTGGPYRLPWRFAPQSTSVSWTVATESDAVEPVVALVESSVPWIVPEAGEVDLVVEPGSDTRFDLPVTILPDAPPGATGQVQLTVVSMRDPSLVGHARTTVVLSPPFDPGGPQEFTIECGDELAGDCFVPHANESCGDPGCCELVCSVDPVCCVVGWDDACVADAVLLCVSD